MSNSFLPEMHVAQQRRRNKLRIQHLEELEEETPNNFLHQNNNNNGNGNSNNNASQMMLLSPEMLNFTAHSSNHYPNIHPTRFIAPSSSDSCDPSQQQQQHLQNCENWVPSFGHANVDDHQGRRQLTSVVVPQFLAHNSHDQNAEIDYQNSVQSWGNGGNNELPLLPGNFVSHQPLNDAITSHHPHHARGLSLSLSSNQICEFQQQLGEPRELKPFESGSISSVVKLDSGGSHVQDVAGSSIQHVHRNVGPLGPFTGYSAILKSSKFLKPAQHLLDEFFGAAGLWRVGEDSANGLSSRGHNMDDCSMAMVSKVHGSSNDLSGGSASCESYRPDCHERKAKLLHMQEEVCKRHRQYHQQMQMVMSAFESVPGLSNATPYISHSLKAISRHFRCLKNAIADQLKHIKRALGEDLSSPTSFLKGESSSRLRYDQVFSKAKSGAVGVIGHLGHQTHVWRPQRGLPERAVSILRAWLFDHFLHPYPTDNDKQMLATQTGLTRNQVSNWFINARVRLWKPMVEEIHMLETKGSSCAEPNSSNNGMSAVLAKHRPMASGNQSSGCKPPLNPVCDSKQLECSGPSSTAERSRGRDTCTEQLFQKCSRIESHHQVPESLDSSFIGFLPYQRRGPIELGGLGAVSLTLGLRHGSENTQQHLQHQFLPQGMPFGGHVIHDFSC